MATNSVIININITINNSAIYTNTETCFTEKVLNGKLNTINFTRFNVFLRDKFECQYCGSPDDLTFDHLVPRRFGGQTTWENIVTACSPCNLRKGGKMPRESGMRPHQMPFQPRVHDLHNNGRSFPPNYLHESWRDFLYWDSELETT